MLDIIFMFKSRIIPFALVRISNRLSQRVMWENKRKLRTVRAPLLRSKYTVIWPSPAKRMRITFLQESSIRARVYLRYCAVDCKRTR